MISKIFIWIASSKANHPEVSMAAFGFAPSPSDFLVFRVRSGLAALDVGGAPFDHGHRIAPQHFYNFGRIVAYSNLMQRIVLTPAGSNIAICAYRKK